MSPSRRSFYLFVPALNADGKASPVRSPIQIATHPGAWICGQDSSLLGLVLGRELKTARKASVVACLAESSREPRSTNNRRFRCVMTAHRCPDHPRNRVASKLGVASEKRLSQ